MREKILKWVDELKDPREKACQFVRFKNKPCLKMRCNQNLGDRLKLKDLRNIGIKSAKIIVQGLNPYTFLIVQGLLIEGLAVLLLPSSNIFFTLPLIWYDAKLTLTQYIINLLRFSFK